MITVSIYEYDEEGHLEIVKEEGRQLGIAEGEKLGIIKGEEKERSNGIKVFIKLCKDLKEKQLLNELNPLNNPVDSSLIETVPF